MRDIKRLIIEDGFELGDYMLNAVFDGGYECAGVIADYEIVEEIMNCLMLQASDYDLRFGYVNIDSPEKDTPYSISVFDYGDIFIEEAYNDNGLKKCGLPCLYVQAKYKDELKKVCTNNEGEVYVFFKEGEEEEEEEEEGRHETRVLTGEDNKVYGMEYNYSNKNKQYKISYTSSEPVNLVELADKISKMIVKLER